MGMGKIEAKMGSVGVAGFIVTAITYVAGHYFGIDLEPEAVALLSNAMTFAAGYMQKVR